MTWVQLSEQEAKMQQGWKDGHLLSIRILYVITFLWCIIKFSPLLKFSNISINLHSFNAFLCLIVLAYLIKVIRSKNKHIVLTFIALPVLITLYTVANLLLVASTNDAALYFGVASPSLILWGVVLFLYSRFSKAYRLNYLHQVKAENNPIE